MPRARTIAFLVAAATTSLFDHNDSALAQAQPCRSREYAHNAYTVCEVDLAEHTVRLYWKRSDGTPYAYLSNLPRALEREAGTLLFATNAGMFDPALKPARPSKREMVWEYARMAKSCSPSLMERCRLTPLHAYSV